MRWLAVSLVLLWPQAGPDQTVVTRDGKVHEGAVTYEGSTIVVKTASGPVRLPAISVVAVYANLPEARRVADRRLDEAKRLFEEASSKPDSDALRRRQLTVSLDICSEIRDFIQVIEKRAPPSEREPLQDVMRRLPQLMRLVRDAKGATAPADGHVGTPVAAAAIERLNLAIDPPPEGARRPEITDTLPPGPAAAVAGLESEDAGVRAASAQKLTSPPSPHAIPALAKALRAEKDKEVMAFIVAALARLDLASHFKTDFDWAPAEQDMARRLALVSLARRQPSRAACEFLVECIKTNPPIDNRVRAYFGSAFRKHRARAIEELKDALMKSKELEVQIEAVKHLGMMRDRTTLPSLKVAMSGPKELMVAAFYAIEKTGGVAVPLVMELLNDGNEEIRRVARLLAQRICREEIDGLNELQKWYSREKRRLEDDEKDFWKEQEKADFPVSIEDYQIYAKKLPAARDW